jgi:hypothetical protein
VATDLTGGRLEEARRYAEQGGLAGAVGAEQGDHRAGWHPHGDVVEDHRAAVAGRDVEELEHQATDPR